MVAEAVIKNLSVLYQDKLHMDNIRNMADSVTSIFKTVQSHYDWRKRTLLTKLYFIYKEEKCIDTPTPAGNINLEVNPEWGRAYRYATGKTYEPMLMNALYQELSKDDVFYNIGARWGIFSLFAENCGLNPQNIHSFEADSERFEILSNNVGNQHIINNVFVSDSDEKKSVTLDSYMSGTDTPTIMKLDIEGAELKALRGAETLLDEAMPELHIEVHPKYIKNMDGNQQDLVNLLSAKGYDIEIACTDQAEFEPIEQKVLPENPPHGNYRLHAV